MAEGKELVGSGHRDGGSVGTAHSREWGRAQGEDVKAGSAIALRVRSLNFVLL